MRIRLSPFPPFLPVYTAIARMKARGPPALDPMEEDEQEPTPAGMLQDLSLCDPPSDATREDDVVEEENYVKVRVKKEGRMDG